MPESSTRRYQLYVSYHDRSTEPHGMGPDHSTLIDALVWAQQLMLDHSGIKQTQVLQGGVVVDVMDSPHQTGEWWAERLAVSQAAENRDAAPMTGPTSTVLGRYFDAEQQLVTARAGILDLLERTFREWFTGAAWVTLFDDPDEREVALCAILAADGSLIADISKRVMFPQLGPELAAEWLEELYRAPKTLNKWLTRLYQNDALEDELPREFAVDCYPLDDNRPCLALYREAEDT